MGVDTIQRQWDRQRPVRERRVRLERWAEHRRAVANERPRRTRRARHGRQHNQQPPSGRAEPEPAADVKRRIPRPRRGAPEEGREQVYRVYHLQMRIVSVGQKAYDSSTPYMTIYTPPNEPSLSTRSGLAGPVAAAAARWSRLFIVSPSSTNRPTNQNN